MPSWKNVAVAYSKMAVPMHKPLRTKQIGGHEYTFSGLQKSTVFLQTQFIIYDGSFHRSNDRRGNGTMSLSLAYTADIQTLPLHLETQYSTLFLFHAFHSNVRWTNDSFTSLRVRQKTNDTTVNFRDVPSWFLAEGAFIHELTCITNFRAILFIYYVSFSSNCLL